MKSRKAVSSLQAHIGFWMRLVSNNVSHSFARKLESSGVTVAEWVILREIFESDGGAVAPSEVAASTGLTRGAVSKLIDRLLAKKLLTRVGAVDDRRYQEIELTRAGRGLVPLLAKRADDNDEFFFSGLTKDERKTLLALLRKTAEMNGLTKMPLD